MRPGHLSVLILGGYGTFGGRLAELLADEPRLTLIIAGRSYEKALAFCTRLSGESTVLPLAFDRDGDLEAQIRRISPDLIVDATGPFQLYGAEPYRVARVALALGLDYLDLADDAAFVEGISQFGAEASVRGAFALSGVSSFPALTAAVVRRLAEGMACVEGIVGGLAPTPYAGLGLSVMRAIAGYAGQRITLIDGGREVVRYPFTESRRYTIAPPGRVPLNARFSLVDVPDLKILPKLWPAIRSIWMGAAPTPEILHPALTPSHGRSVCGSFHPCCRLPG